MIHYQPAACSNCNRIRHGGGSLHDWSKREGARSTRAVAKIYSCRRKPTVEACGKLSIGVSSAGKGNCAWQIARGYNGNDFAHWLGRGNEKRGRRNIQTEIGNIHSDERGGFIRLVVGITRVVHVDGC